MGRSTELSVIIPAYRAGATLSRVLSALRPQVSDDVEVLVLDSSGSAQSRELQRCHPWVEVVDLPQRTLPGRARNLGVERATGSLLAFLDADAVPGPAWLTRMRSRLRNPQYVGVAGSILNGTPGSAVGTAIYLLEFLDWSPGRARSPAHAASCNLLVRRGAFEAAGGFCEDVWPGEDTILTFPWGKAQTLAYAGDSPVWHLNRTRLRDLLSHQYRLGVAYADICDQVDFPHRAFSRWPLLCTAPAARLLSLAVRLNGQPRLRAEALMIGPWLLMGLLAWGCGVGSARARGSRFPTCASR